MSQRRRILKKKRRGLQMIRIRLRRNPQLNLKVKLQRIKMKKLIKPKRKLKKRKMIRMISKKN